MNQETYGSINAYLAALPGGNPYNLRKLLITNENHVDMVPWFLPAEGERENGFLRSRYLIEFETAANQSLFFFNPHVEDVAHTLVLGATGSGKSFLLNALLTHAQQYAPNTFIFDVGGSYRSLTEALGGAYVRLTPGQKWLSINPFCLPPTKENLEFLFSFAKLLVESDGFRMNDGQDRELFAAIESLYQLEAEHRRLLTLSTTVSKKLGDHLLRWTEGQQYGEWFDNSTDTVSFAAIQCIDFEGMERLGVVLEPVLFYLLHRVSDVIDRDKTIFKLAVFDEAWLMFKHPVTRAYILNAVRTWRKKNAALILATQSLQDLNDAHRPLVENCPTKLLLSNPRLDAAFYSDVLRLNPVEVEKVRALSPKGQFLMKREGLSKVLTLNVDPKSYWLFTTNPFEAKRREELVREVGLSAALEVLKGEK
jgi:type IV secretion system protein VirB4